MSNKSNNFYYFDLIQPRKYTLFAFVLFPTFVYEHNLIFSYSFLEPRKTLHVLTTLLNFFVYYKMVKKDVVDLANSKIKEYENIMETKSKFQCENEKAKLRAESVGRFFCSYFFMS